jgi:hypothetical protein
MAFYLLYMRDKDGNSFRREQLAMWEWRSPLSIFLISCLYSRKGYTSASALKPIDADHAQRARCRLHGLVTRVFDFRKRNSALLRALHPQLQYLPSPAEFVSFSDRLDNHPRLRRNGSPGGRG